LICALADSGALPNISVSGVIADRECPALNWASGRGMDVRKLTYSRSQPGALRDALVQTAPDLIVTTVHKILDDQLVALYAGGLINLHYSLLPAFASRIGMEPVRMARAHGCRLVGATAHRVTADLDAGPILAQACTFDDTRQPESALHDAVFRCGGVALAAAIDEAVNSSAPLVGGHLQAGNVLVCAAPVPRANVCSHFQDDTFWEGLR
jgi:phosphoribosylglycinamide formyltransferase 1